VRDEVPSLCDQAPLNTRLPDKDPCDRLCLSPSGAGECDLAGENNVPGGEHAEVTLGAVYAATVSERASTCTDPAMLLGSGAKFCCG